MGDVRVIMSGGLGNQLFQYSFAHFLHHKFQTKVVIVKYRQFSGLAHTKESFFNKKYRCNHCSYKINNGNTIINEIINPWNSRLSHRNVSDLRAFPYISASEFQLDNIFYSYIGYFQNKDFVVPVKNEIRSEISEILLRNMSEEIMRISVKDSEVIHVRQGDTMSLENRRKVGVLSPNYYQETLGSSTGLSQRIVVTDDIPGAKLTMKDLKIDLFLGPEDINPWESLYIMSRAKKLIAANSTFSWWGGFLCFLNGGQVVIPNPFFKNRDLNTKGAFAYPGFSESKADFIP